MGFISLHGRNGFGGFVRSGSQSGVGLGLGLNFEPASVRFSCGPFPKRI